MSACPLSRNILVQIVFYMPDIWHKNALCWNFCTIGDNTRPGIAGVQVVVTASSSEVLEPCICCMKIWSSHPQVQRSKNASLCMMTVFKILLSTLMSWVNEVIFCPLILMAQKLCVLRVLLPRYVVHISKKLSKSTTSNADSSSRTEAHIHAS